LRTLVIGARGTEDAYHDWSRAREMDEAGAILVRPDGYVAWRHSHARVGRQRGHGTHAWGRWVGMSYDGPVVTGWGAMARTQQQAHQVVRDMVDKEAS
jgi:hypothetical protein